MSSNPQFDFAKSFGRKSGGRRVSPLSITVGILVAAAIALVSLSGFMQIGSGTNLLITPAFGQPRYLLRCISSLVLV